jgi:RiboL-PSP-HEPN
MRNRKLSSDLQRLHELFKKADAACGTDFEMRAHWARYLCVLTAGFLENAIEEVYGDFVRNAASRPVADYAISVLSKIQNPNTTKFVETARSFRPDWASALEMYLNDEGRGDAINSIMSNRHLIVHGKNSGITIVRIKEYLGKSIEVIEFVERLCAA